MPRGMGRYAYWLLDGLVGECEFDFGVGEQELNHSRLLNIGDDVFDVGGVTACVGVVDSFIAYCDGCKDECEVVSGKFVFALECVEEVAAQRGEVVGVGLVGVVCVERGHAIGHFTFVKEFVLIFFEDHEELGRRTDAIRVGDGGGGDREGEVVDNGKFARVLALEINDVDKWERHFHVETSRGNDNRVTGIGFIAQRLGHIESYIIVG